jgi:NAD+ synthase
VSPVGEITPEVLEIDCERVAGGIVSALRHVVGRELRRQGAVLGLSGGVDSSVTAALCALAFGRERTVALLMPERESGETTLGLSLDVAEAIGIETVQEEITPILEAARCYERRNDAVRNVIPGFTGGWRWKIVLPPLLGSDTFRLYSIVAESPEGEHVTARLPAETYLAIVAATNLKQRVRKLLEYHHADRLNYAVVGTPNRLEYDQGFFVKVGDGAADVKPIAHLYKTQVYRLGAHLGIPEAVLARVPTTDTYSLPQTQDEFYFSLPYEKLDLCLYAHNHALPPEAVAGAVELSPGDVVRVFRDIEQKRRATRYLHLPPLLVEPVAEVPGRAAASD